MSGPPPKDPRLRQRRNKTSTAATLPAVGDPEGVIARLQVALPVRGPNEPWHPLTLAFWREVWASPMALEYVAADVPGLQILATLMDGFHYGDLDLAAEIRLQRQCFGLTPLDRRRLQWEVERVSEAQARAARRSTGQQPQPKVGSDPRRVLKAVK